MDAVIAFLITLLVGPCAFWILTRIVSYTHTFPSSITGAIGDTVFLPLFNALAVHYGLLSIVVTDNTVMWLSLLITGVFSVSYFIYRKKFPVGGEWMYKENHDFTFAARYHFGYVIAQSFLIVISLIYFYYAMWLWVCLFGYIFTIPTVRALMAKFY